MLFIRIFLVTEDCEGCQFYARYCINISPSTPNTGDPLQFQSQQNAHTVNKCMIILSKYTLLRDLG